MKPACRMASTARGKPLRSGHAATSESQVSLSVSTCQQGAEAQTARLTVSQSALEWQPHRRLLWPALEPWHLPSWRAVYLCLPGKQRYNFISSQVSFHQGFRVGKQTVPCCSPPCVSSFCPSPYLCPFPWSSAPLSVCPDRGELHMNIDKQCNSKSAAELNNGRARAVMHCGDLQSTRHCFSERLPTLKKQQMNAHP